MKAKTLMKNNLSSYQDFLKRKTQLKNEIEMMEEKLNFDNLPQTFNFFGKKLGLAAVKTIRNKNITEMFVDLLVGFVTNKIIRKKIGKNPIVRVGIDSATAIAVPFLTNKIKYIFSEIREKIQKQILQNNKKKSEKYIDSNLPKSQ